MFNFFINAYLLFDKGQIMLRKQIILVLKVADYYLGKL